MGRSYSMQAVQGAADRAVRLATRWLLTEAEGSRVHDVQNDPRFQHRGVDLLWEKSDGSVLGVEVKGDRQGARRGNYFLELVSNLEKDTPGCFLYSTADLMLYVFLQNLQLHVIPLRPAREWFLPRGKSYQLRHTQTRMGDVVYTTVGALVPCKELQREVAGARVVEMLADLATT